MSYAIDTAEQRFRAAFDRLKNGASQVLPCGAPVSQNNVAKEAGTDSSALRKTRYPALVREIQAWVEIERGKNSTHLEERKVRTRARRELKDRVRALTAQRDNAQSLLLSAQRRVLELLQENSTLRSRLDELLPPPTLLKKPTSRPL
jgi:hypothetical protein